MASEVEIYNLALSNVAAKAFVTSLTEDSNERKFCSVNFKTALNTVLEDHDWNFASKHSESTLALIRDSNDDPAPPAPWLYEYQYPSDVLYIREVLRQTDNEDEVPFGVALNVAGTGNVILTDKQDAKIRYTKRIKNETLLSSKAVEAVGWKLASMIAIPLTKDLEIKQNTEQQYLLSLASASTSNFNEGVNRKAPDPAGIQIRS